MAAQAFYRDHGEFPLRVADLQPKYLKSLPDDPFSPSPATVIYKSTGDDAVVYSRFDDAIDDGGTEVSFEEARGAWPNDFGIRIRKPRYPPLFALRPRLAVPKSK